MCACVPLFGNDSVKLGFALWHYRWVSLGAELVVLGVGAALWLRDSAPIARRRGRVIALLAVLVVLAFVTPFMPPPGGPNEFVVSALVGYVSLAGLAAWVDRESPQRR